MPANKDFEIKNGLRVNNGLINANNGVVAVTGNVSVSSALSVTGNTSLTAVSAGTVTVANGLTTSATTVPVTALNTLASGATANLNWNVSSVYTMSLSGNTTLNLQNLPSGFWQMHLFVTNLGAKTLSWQVGGSSSTVSWLKGDGTSSTSFSTMGITPGTGVTHVTLWGVGNASIYGKAA